MATDSETLDYLTGCVRLLLFVAAAKDTATPAQQYLLSRDIPAVLETFADDGDYAPLLATLAEVMGEDWVPSQEFQDYIDGLTA